MIAGAKLVIFFTVIGVLMAGLFFAGSWSAESHPQGALQVAASFYPLWYFSSQVGGSKAEVFDLTPPGAEPHDYELTPGDAVHIEQSRLLVLNGGNFEAWSADIAQNLPASVVVVQASQGLATRQLSEGGTVSIDPHVWLDPVLAGTMVQRIADGFIKADPANADYYRKNAAGLQQRLADLDQAYRQGLADCRQQDIVTSHAAFGYLAQEYGLHQVPIAGLSPDAEPSSEQLAGLAALVKSRQIRYIFFESLASPRLAQTLAQETGAGTLVLNPLEGLTKNEVFQGQDYFTIMDQNLQNLKVALQCR